jgi:hypothetical protein
LTGDVLSVLFEKVPANSELHHSVVKLYAPIPNKFSTNGLD